jgi:hypothetical protein
MREKLIALLGKYFDIGDSYAYNLTRVKTAFEVGTMSLEDFEEFDEETIADLADYLIENGVIIPVKCGDCKYNGDHGSCSFHSSPFFRVSPNDYCNCGKIKESEE